MGIPKNDPKGYSNGTLHINKPWVDGPSWVAICCGEGWLGKARWRSTFYGPHFPLESNMGVCQNLLLSMLVGWTPINPSYFDVHKRATFGFDPVRHIRGFGWSGGNTPGWFDQHLKDVVNKSNSILVSAVGTCPSMGWQKRENRNRKPSIFPWVIWDFPVSFLP